MRSAATSLRFSTCGLNRRSRQVVMNHAVKRSPGDGLLDASPLLEEERHCLISTLIADRSNPIWIDRASTFPTLASGDYPVDTVEIQMTEVLKQGLNRQKPHRGR